jgi:hypothetical protein
LAIGAAAGQEALFMAFALPPAPLPFVPPALLVPPPPFVPPLPFDPPLEFDPLAPEELSPLAPELLSPLAPEELSPLAPELEFESPAAPLLLLPAFDPGGVLFESSPLQ